MPKTDQAYFKNYYNAINHGRIRPNLVSSKLSKPPRPAGACPCAGDRAKLMLGKYAGQR